MATFLKDREAQIVTKGAGEFKISCAKESLAGSVSQRACVFCGSRVVLYPIADAVHLVHGPIGCAAYTWDIRGALSSGPELHRLSFSTDLNEKDVIFGGEPKLYRTLHELIAEYKPAAAFVYSTCIVGIIGDDVEAVCRRVSQETGVDVLPVHAEGFRGTKKDGYKAACDALGKLVGTLDSPRPGKVSINLLGEFNLAGELWMLEAYYKRMGIEVVGRFTGDGRVNDIRRAHMASLNIVQCSGSMIYLAKEMKEKFGIPFQRVSYFGIEDMSEALYGASEFFGLDELYRKTRGLVSAELEKLLPELKKIKNDLVGKKAAIYVGGAFKAVSLVKALRRIGIKTVVCGSQTGNEEDYEMIRQICDDGTVIVDDSNPVELSTLIKERGVDVFIGGVKERPLAFKLGVGFCDHNHERKQALAGYDGMLNFAREVHSTITSPVWKFAKSGGAES